MKRKKMARKKKPKPPKASTLWRNFSNMIRLRDCLATTGTTTHCVCCTCGQVVPFGKSLHAGHWHPQRRNSVKYCEANCHGQCATCNTGLGGNPHEYDKFMRAHYGEDVMDWISRTSNNVIWRITAAEAREMNQHYMRTIEAMKGAKNEG